MNIDFLLFFVENEEQSSQDDENCTIKQDNDLHYLLFNSEFEKEFTDETTYFVDVNQAFLIPTLYFDRFIKY